MKNKYVFMFRILRMHMNGCQNGCMFTLVVATCGNLANARYIGCRNVIINHWHRRQTAAAKKLGLKVKQMNVVMGILREREVLIKRCGKSLLRSPALHLRRFSYSLSQVRGITSLQPRRNGDSVAIAAHV